MSHHCGRFQERPITRREALQRCAGGFGAVALAGLFADTQGRAIAAPLPHHATKVRSVIFLYMDGGPSQVDTFDPKPRLTKENGRPFGMEMEATQFDNNGNTLGSPWKFKRYGESGLEVSDLFPNVAECADMLCVVRSMTSKFSEHTNANYFLHTGHGLAGRPSMGAWASYGLGSETKDLPDFVVLDGGLIPPGGLDCFANGFLPASHQGSIIVPRGDGMANVRPTGSGDQRATLEFIQAMDALRGTSDAAVESAIANYELAFRM